MVETLIIAEQSSNPAENGVSSDELDPSSAAEQNDQLNADDQEHLDADEAEVVANAPTDEFSRPTVFARSRSSQAEEKSRKLALLCAKVADDYRGSDVVVLDLTSVTPIFDYFVIATGTSRRQMHAVAEEVDRVLNEHGSERLGIEGYDVSQWIIQDYGDVVLHVFSDEARQLYDLESLWADAGRVDWRSALGIPAEKGD